MSENLDREALDALRRMLAAWDAWDAAEHKRYSDQVWRERLRYCREFEDAVTAGRAIIEKLERV